MGVVCDVFIYRGGSCCVRHLAFAFVRRRRKVVCIVLLVFFVSRRGKLCASFGLSVCVAKRLVVCLI